MIMKARSTLQILQSHTGNKIPLKYKDEVIGIAFVKDDCIVMVADKYESELKRAMDEPGLSGFSIEISDGDNK